jgi:hypothetical protein
MSTLNIFGHVTHTGHSGPVSNAKIWFEGDDPVYSDPAGRFKLTVTCENGRHILHCAAFGKSSEHPLIIDDSRSHDEVHFDLHLGFRITIHQHSNQEERLVPATYAVVGRRVVLRAETAVEANIKNYSWNQHSDVQITELGKEAEFVFGRPGRRVIETTIYEANGDYPASASVLTEVTVSDSDIQRIGGHISVTLDRAPSDPTLDEALWEVILDRTHAISFKPYREFLNRVFELKESDDLSEGVDLRKKLYGTELGSVGFYKLLSYATGAFLLLECGVHFDRRRHHRWSGHGDERWQADRHYSREELERKLREYLGEPPQLPYLRRVIDAAFPYFDGYARGADRPLTAGLNEPLLIELFYEYWLEQGMLMQTVNAISRRFQNIRRGGPRDPLANLEIDPLRPLNNLLYAWDRAKPDRLTAEQRSLEYLYGYGMVVPGSGTSRLQPAEIRCNFLEAFHNLLFRAMVFYKEDSQATVRADGFPLLTALKEVNLILAQGAHNSFFGTTFQARVETLMMQFILARPEMRNFLQSRVMVPYKEAWMPQVDGMKTLQGWDGTSVTQYYDLAVFGEQIALSARFGDWAGVDDEDSAKNWARRFKRVIMGFANAYRAVTGFDLTNPITSDAKIPAIRSQQCLVAQQTRPEAPNMLTLTPAVGQMTPRLSNFARRSDQ